MSNIVIIQARMGSTRFPGKILEQLHGIKVIDHVVETARKIDLIDKVVVATSVSAQETPLLDHCEKNDIEIFQGDEHDVLSRYYHAAKAHDASRIMRLTADCPVLDPAICSQVLLMLIHDPSVDYASNVCPPTWPDGLDCEVFTFEALEKAFQQATNAIDREHVTSYMQNNRHLFKVANFSCPLPKAYKYRWTVDVPEDLVFLEKLLQKSEGKKTISHLIQAQEKYFDTEETVKRRNASFHTQQSLEPVEITNFSKSQEMLHRALKTVPLGSQTFSKSYIQYPENSSPHFLTHGLGSHVWDVDGNEYVDLVAALLPNILGYVDPDVNFAVQTQLCNGVSMSLATELEVELSEKICSLVPSAQKVRFGKNGTDATSAAIRLARAYTKREKILVCGYHGWQDWYIGTTTRNLGVPKSVCELSESVAYNDIDRVQSLLQTEEYAGMIMEPCNITAPENNYLKEIKKTCEKYGSVLIFDEIITGFRFSLGGAQEYFGVTPHLSCFGKAIANGFPLSVVTGQSDIMNKMEEIFFSGTFNGEVLSIVAALATIDKIESENVIEGLWEKGEKLSSEVQKLIEKFKLQDFVSIEGFAPWKLLSFHGNASVTNFEINTFYLQEMIHRGILINGSHNLCHAFSHEDLQKTIKAYENTFDEMANALNNGSFQKQLRSKTIEPIFKVR